jgi:hypothetical protein
MTDYLEVARRALAAVNLSPTTASAADSTGVPRDASAASPVAPQRETTPKPAEVRPTWAEWKAAALNQLFQEQGVTGQPGRITAATVLKGERAGQSNEDRS